MYAVAGTKLLHPDQILADVGVGEDSRVADLGCGRLGQFTMPASRAVGRFGVVYAADLHRDALREVGSMVEHNRLQNVELIWTDLEDYGHTSIPQGTIDVALLINTLVYARNRQYMLKEAARLLKPGAQLVVIDWHPSSSLTSIAEAAALVPLDPPVLELEGLAVGLRLARRFRPGIHHFGLVFEKPRW